MGEPHTKRDDCPIEEEDRSIQGDWMGTFVSRDSGANQEVGEIIELIPGIIKILLLVSTP